MEPSPPPPPPFAWYNPNRVFTESGAFDMDLDVVEIPPPKNFGSTSRLTKLKEVLHHEVIQIDIEDDSSDGRVGATYKRKTISDFGGSSYNGQGKEPFANCASTTTGVEKTGLQNGFQSLISSAPVSHYSNLDGVVYDLTNDDEDEYTDIEVKDYAVDALIPFWLDPPQNQQMQIGVSSSHNSSFQQSLNGVNLTHGINPTLFSSDTLMNMNPFLAGGLSPKTQMSISNHKTPAHAEGFSSSGHVYDSKRKWEATENSIGAETLWDSISRKTKGRGGISSSTYSSIYAEMIGGNIIPGLQKSMSFLPASPTFDYNPSPTFDYNPSPTFDYNPSGSVYFPPCEEESVSSVPYPQVTSSEKIDNVDGVLKVSEHLKQFDVVGDCSDHYFARNESFLAQPQKSWTKAIQEEWKVLQKDLPDTILVRAYESRMDLLRAVIVGAQGTPYHDGLFFFDVSFPFGYPSVPPSVYYHSGGLRLNPNLYQNGKVCLSLLNTWSGNTNEKWIPGISTMLQVLVSIQGLILNEKPFFNEPGYERMMGTPNGEKKSEKYSEETLTKSLKTMLYTMKKPLKHFEEVITHHFRNHAHDILEACKAYMNGIKVGSFVKDVPLSQLKNPGEDKKSCSKTFGGDLAELVNLLVKALTQVGAKDCEKFLVPAPELEEKKHASKKFLVPAPELEEKKHASKNLLEFIQQNLSGPTHSKFITAFHKSYS